MYFMEMRTVSPLFLINEDIYITIHHFYEASIEGSSYRTKTKLLIFKSKYNSCNTK